MNSILEPERVYHIYTHANGNENLFREKENYRYFLKKYGEHIFPVAETLAYCLMPNHLHLMVRVRKEEELEVLFRQRDKTFQKFQTFGKLISKAFSNLLSAYTQAYNKKYNRRGSLFQPNFKRKLIQNDAYFTALIAYIHNNPIHHGFEKEPEEWLYSSWHGYLSDKPTRLAKEEGLAWFGGKEEFLQIHRLLVSRDFKADFE